MLERNIISEEVVDVFSAMGLKRLSVYQILTATFSFVLIFKLEYKLFSYSKFL
ncbi:hypothetical protein ACOJQI_02305 [Bacillus salacetis]|uniref:hypothetical protein n=1 Tax=Bacillus salacetis TaxID=2315464 RepID=UPI003B9FC7C8